MNILIIGLGNIGFAHLKSFFLSKQKYTIDLYDKKKIKFDNFSRIIANKKNIKILKKLPKNKDYKLVIIATSSLERFNLLKKIIKENKVRHLILEKMIFAKYRHYKKSISFTKNHQNKIFVNVWGSLIIYLLKIKIKDKRLPIKFHAIIKEGRLMTNLIHYIDMFCYITKKNLNFDINIEKIFLSKRKPYKEASGKLFGYNKFGSILIESNPNIQTDKILIEVGDDIHKIFINKNKSAIYYKNSKFLKKIPFPFAYSYTFKIFENFMKKNHKEIINNFSFIHKISEQLIFKLEKMKMKIT